VGRADAAGQTRDVGEGRMPMTDVASPGVQYKKMDLSHVAIDWGQCMAIEKSYRSVSAMTGESSVAPIEVKESLLTRLFAGYKGCTRT